VQHGAPEGCSFIKAVNGRNPVEAGCEPRHDQHSPTVPHGPRKARKTNTNPFPQKLDAARKCDANPREESRVRIADLNVLHTDISELLGGSCPHSSAQKETSKQYGKMD
jgi:hypothetical protein